MKPKALQPKNGSFLMPIKLLFFCFLSIQISYGQFSLSGKITNSQGQSLEGAQLHFTSLKLGAVTNKKGVYRFTRVPQGKYVLQVSFLGLKTIDTLIEVNNQPLVINFKLQPASEELSEVVLEERSAEETSALRLRDVDGTAIYAAKKNELILVNKLSANLAANNARQVFARVPGIVVWESDVAGLQLGVGARGLSPDRTANFNTRQNGYDMAADALGYPESYYAPPMQAIQSIEVIRGAASLQYGTQFGGVINLKLKTGNPKKKFSGQTVNTYNSLGYFNTFTDLGGQLGKLNYYSFHNYRAGSGFQNNSAFKALTEHLRFAYRFNARLEIIGEYTYMHYQAQQPGGLTDFQFNNNPSQSLRSRNWFAVNWNLAALTLNIDLNEKTKFNTRTFGLVAERNALGYLNPPNRLDLQPFIDRDLLLDDYLNFGNETRLIHRYTLNTLPQIALVGIRYYQGQTDKTQTYGNSGRQANFNPKQDILHPKSDYRFPSKNVAVFAENIFNLSRHFSLTPGFRFEHVNTCAKGFYDSSVRVPLTGEVVIDSLSHENRNSKRSFVLMGIGAAYKLKKGRELYANYSQNYRAITFNDMRVVNPSAAVDPNLKDEQGFNMDAGVRGNLATWLSADISVFWLSYQNRIGSVLQKVNDEFFGERIVRYTTNIAQANIVGFESYIEIDLLKLLKIKSKTTLSLFSNIAIIEGRYSHSNEPAIEGSKVENVPLFNLKTGLKARYKKLGGSLQFTYLSQQYSEATNAEKSATGIAGTIPAYWVMDVALDYQFKKLKVETGLNNFTNNTYFTRRASGYPGPGIISSAPLNFYLGLGIWF